MRPSFPNVDPPSVTEPRPFWSVMIPTYNRTTYLEHALRSVLDQHPGPEQMQIEVVDNCSTSVDMAAIVRQIAGDRVSVFRQECNVGPTANWNTCVERAIGHWVHILHDDDYVRPGFYERLRRGIENETGVGAAFCRHTYVDVQGSDKFLSSLERESAGVIDGWLERIAVEQRIQCPAIVVRRDVYERLGGFSAEVKSVLDWEMWQRIAVHYPFWFEPEVLACYRVHDGSASTELMLSGANMADMRRAIKLVRSYLPDAMRFLSQKARMHYAGYAARSAEALLTDGCLRGASAQAREALRTDWRSSRRALSVLGRIWLLQMRAFFGKSSRFSRQA